jgi:hypothetical protein
MEAADLTTPSRGWAAVAAAVATLLMLAALAAGTPAVAATRTLSSAESPVRTVDPSHVIPDQIIVQFSRQISGAELTSFETRFRLTYRAGPEEGDGGPYYLFHIDDGMNPPDKRVQILAGERLVSWCGPNLKTIPAAPGSASNESPTVSPSRTPALSASGLLASTAATSSTGPGGPASPDPGSGLPVVAIALIAVIAVVACLILAGVFFRRGRRAA